jgi:hypothetical protein
MLRNTSTILPSILLAALSAGAGIVLADPPATTVVKSEAFDRDPAWDGYNNRMVPHERPTISQDFGYSPTHFASKSAGEVGGTIARAAEPAWYAAKVAPKTLDDKLSASGTFLITHSGGGICFGLFNGNQPSGMGRPVNSLGMMLSGTKEGGRLAIHLITAQNQVCATFVTRFLRYHTPQERAENRPTPIKINTRYHWNLSYDPDANNGAGQIRFIINSEEDKPQDFEGKDVTVDLPAGFKKQGTSFDHFGLINITRPGSPMTIYFGDLQLDGQPVDFSADPNWDGSGNHAKYQAKEIGGIHDFGYSATHYAGGMDGEIGGLIWRSPYAYYADHVGPLTLNDPLEAHGRFVLLSGAPDSGVMLGWFNSSVRQTDDQHALDNRDFIGVSIGGPTRVGHYFLPIYATKQTGRGIVKEGPILKPGKAYDWSLVYDPAAVNGRGQIRVTLGDEAVTLDLKANAKSKDAVFDRFGLFCVGTGGGQVKVYFDDLKYTSGKQ